MAAEQTTAKDQQFREAKTALDEALARDELPSCALDEKGIHQQQARHTRLAPSVTNLERLGDAVIFTFAQDFDGQALAEMVAVEEQCCPFFSFAFDEGKRELTVGVKDEAMLPALEALSDHLGG